MSLLELEKALREKDAIMERNSVQTLREYVAAGGKPATAIDLLADNYRGYAQMMSLVCRWLQDTSEAAAPAGGAGASGSAAAAPAAAPPATPTHDEYYFAEAVVRERFDGARVDAALSGARAAPGWFLALMDTPRGRRLLYALAEQHRSCSTLRLAISLAWQRGHVEEVAQLGASSGASFDIFHGVLRLRLDTFLQAADDTSREAAVAELRRLCGGSPATYLFTQMVLCEAGGEPGGEPLRRLSEELEAGVPGGPRAAAALLRRMTPLLARSDEDAAAVTAAGALLEAAERGGSVAPQAARLWDLYRAAAAREEAAAALQQHDAGGAMDVDGENGHAANGSHDAATPPLGAATSANATSSLGVEPLRVPAVLHALLREAFSSGARGAAAGGAAADASAATSAAVELLALACSAPEERAATREALAAAARVAGAAATGAAADLETLSTVMAVPVAASGLVSAVTAELAAPDFHRRVHAATSLSAYVALLCAAATSAPATHAAVVDGLAKALRALGRGAHPERAEQLLQLAPALLRAGCVAPVLSMAERWAADTDADPSLVRTFISSAFAVAAPPYSRAFAAALLRLCAVSGMRRGAPGAEDFAAEVARQQRSFDPPLSAEEKKALRELLV